MDTNVHIPLTVLLLLYLLCTSGTDVQFITLIRVTVSRQEASTTYKWGEKVEVFLENCPEVMEVPPTIALHTAAITTSLDRINNLQQRRVLVVVVFLATLSLSSPHSPTKLCKTTIAATFVPQLKHVFPFIRQVYQIAKLSAFIGIECLNEMTWE